MIVAITLSVSALIMVAIYFLPHSLLRHSRPQPNQRLTTAEWYAALNGIRSLFLQAIGGGVLLLGLLYSAHTLRTGQRTLDLQRKTQNVEQFTQANEQLSRTGFENTDLRAGAIYSLGMLTEESSAYRQTIYRMLESYLFQHDSRAFVPDNPRQNRGTSGDPVLDADFQAAIIVLTSLPRDDDVEPANLVLLELGGADFRNANLQNAALRSTNLEWADFRGADIRGADLSGTCLRRTRFDPGQLETALTDSFTITDNDTAGRVCGRAAE